MARRSILAVAALVAGVVLAGCGSSGSSSSTTSSVVSTTTPSATIPEALRPVCTALAGAAPIDSLQPTNAVDWPAERDRVVTAARADARAYQSAAESAPKEIASQLPKMVAYAKAIANATENSGSFSEATSMISTYPDKVGASLAMSTVENWKRTNCK